MAKGSNMEQNRAYTINGFLPTVHVLVLQAACFVEPRLPASKLNSYKHEMITKYLMLSTRLLNDLQSYKVTLQDQFDFERQKEERDGKKILILLYPNAKIEESTANVESILDQTKKKLLEHALMDGLDGMSKACKLLYLSTLKVFQMFFNSANHFDSNTALLDAIKKAIYIPLEDQAPKPLKPIAQPPRVKETTQ
ncbi:hypothetical protein Ancab_005278 [Ancistrocladus abbreviatus]